MAATKAVMSLLICLFSSHKKMVTATKYPDASNRRQIFQDSTCKEDSKPEERKAEHLFLRKLFAVFHNDWTIVQCSAIMYNTFSYRLLLSNSKFIYSEKATLDLTDIT